jgi:hypothetical protein
MTNSFERPALAFALLSFVLSCADATGASKESADTPFLGDDSDASPVTVLTEPNGDAGRASRDAGRVQRAAIDAASAPTIEHDASAQAAPAPDGVAPRSEPPSPADAGGVETSRDAGAPETSPAAATPRAAAAAASGRMGSAGSVQPAPAPVAPPASSPAPKAESAPAQGGAPTSPQDTTPPAVEEPMPTVVEEPMPTVVEEPAPSAEEEPTPTTGPDAAPTGDQEPLPADEDEDEPEPVDAGVARPGAPVSLPVRADAGAVEPPARPPVPSTPVAAQGCTPGRYSGEFLGELTQAGLGRVQLRGSIALELALADNGRALVVESSLIEASDPLGTPIRAQIEGRVDCATQQLENGTLRGRYGSDGSSNAIGFEGVVRGTRTENPATLAGAWTVPAQSEGPKAEGTYRATLQD